ncbi:MAG: anthranilate phosphoribosyltransferase [Planctomycetota bacterium]|jgi:anthranilate phosphoribosyltransferase
MIQETLAKLVRSSDLTMAEAASAMGEIMDGKATPAQIAGFLTAMHMKGETVPEIVGCAKAMRAHAVRVKAPSGVVLDTCGTGGDGKGTFNISTISALVVAAAGVTVAKHGNRAASSKCGSSDLLEQLGLRIELPAKRLERMLREEGFAYMHAPAFHPAMKYAGPVRRELRVRTIFNILGPLCNPACANVQTMGVFSPDLVRPMAEVLKKLGSRSVFTFHGADGLDELSTTGSNRVARLQSGRVRTLTLSPGSVGLRRARVKDLLGGDPSTNAAIARSVLSGDRGPCRDAVLFNAGVALVAAGKAKSPREGVKRAADAIDGGAAERKLLDLIGATQGEG